MLFTYELLACERSSDFQAGLLGSIVTPGSSINSALIKLTDSKAGWFSEGDIIQMGYVLNEIHKDYILVHNINKNLKIYLNSCEPLVEMDNPNLYLAVTDVAEPSEIDEGIINTELTVQQQRIFLKAPAINNGDAEIKTSEMEQSAELTKGQARIFHEIPEPEIELENIELEN